MSVGAPEREVSSRTSKEGEFRTWHISLHNLLKVGQLSCASFRNTRRMGEAGGRGTSAEEVSSNGVRRGGCGGGMVGSEWMWRVK